MKRKRRKSILASKLTVSEMARMGGIARAANLTPERRKQIAKEAVNARWRKGEMEKHKGV